MHAVNAGGSDSLVDSKKEPFWLFDIFNFRPVGKRFDKLLRHRRDCISVQQLHNRDLGIFLAELV